MIDHRMTRRRSGAGWLLALAGLIAGSPVEGVAQSTPLTLEPCRLPGVTEEARCGTYMVWEDRAARAGRRIGLRVVLLPARGPNPLPDPIVMLQGGPGSSNVGSAAGSARLPWRDRRAILLVDLRGTGGSHALECDLRDPTSRIQTDFFPVALVRQCRDSLARRANLALYTPTNAIDDLHEVIEALGIEQVNLRGASAGTRQALEFIRRYPRRVRSALLEGPVPMDARMPLTFAQDAQESLDGILADCAAETACAERFPALRQDLARTLERLGHSPETIVVLNPQSGDPVQVPVTPSAYAQVLRYLLYQPQAARLVPLTIHQAARGDFTPIAQRLRTLGIPQGIAMGFYLSFTCAEDLPWFEEADAAVRSAGTFLGTYRVRQQKAACEVWPRGEVPATHLEPVRSDVPVLVLVGERDPVTPPRWGAEVVEPLSRGRLIVVPGGHHSFGGLESADCLDTIRVQFINEGAPDRLDVSCVASMRRAPFLLESPD